jgi:Paired amphipathic helix repeat
MLKVEDAQLYLDQIQMEFSLKPEIYHEFLDIMRNFKARTIDTPGVIARVSTLFRGYDKLILGFNAFLPDEYTIELSDIEEMNRAHAAKLAAESARSTLPQGQPGGSSSMPEGAQGGGSGSSGGNRDIMISAPWSGAGRYPGITGSTGGDHSASPQGGVGPVVGGAFAAFLMGASPPQQP